MGLKYGSDQREILQISIDDVNKRGDPYQLMMEESILFQSKILKNNLK
ncbi:MAG: hypothetical protein WD966_05595 [Nitrosopumilaceae archaeon]